MTAVGLSIDEVRSRLFRVRFSLYSEYFPSKIRRYKETFKLSGRVYKLDCFRNPRSDGSSVILHLYRNSFSNIGQSKSSSRSLHPCRVRIQDVRHDSSMQTIDANGRNKWVFPLRNTNNQVDCIIWMDFRTAATYEREMANGLLEKFTNQALCDVEFLFENGQKIGAHVLTLSAASPVFADMFRTGFIATQTRTVVIEDIDFEVFKQLLIYLYTGNAPQLGNKDITRPLLEAADKYNVQTLKRDCIDVLLATKEEWLTEESAIDMLAWSQFYSISEITQVIMQFLKNECWLIRFLPNEI